MFKIGLALGSFVEFTVIVLRKYKANVRHQNNWIEDITSLTLSGMIYVIAQLLHSPGLFNLHQ